MSIYQKPPQGRPHQLNVYVSEEMMVDLLTVTLFRGGSKGYTDGTLAMLAAALEDFKLGLTPSESRKWEVLRMAIEANFRIRIQQRSESQRERDTDKLRLEQRMQKY